MALGTTKISTTLVATTLGAGSNDVGTLCSHPHVNPWSRCKPFYLGGIIGAASVDSPHPAWGINYSFEIDLEVLLYLPDIETQNWRYLKPAGTATSPFRLGDFRGYSHTAAPFIMCAYPPNYTKKLPSDDSYGMKLLLSRHDATRINGGLAISDFVDVIGTMGIADMYFAVYCYNSATNKHAIYRCSSTVGAGGYEVIIPTSWLIANAPAKAMMCLCNSNFGIDESYQSPYTGVYCPIPHGSALTKITNSECTITVDVMASLSTIAVLKVIGISSTLTGTYDPIENYYSTDASTGSFTAGAGADIFFKCQLYIANPSGLTDISINAADIVVTLFDGGVTTYTLSGTNGDVYDASFV